MRDIRRHKEANINDGIEELPEDDVLEVFSEGNVDDPDGGEFVGLVMVLIAVFAHKKLKKR
jgi:hypothetical protein